MRDSSVIIFCLQICVMLIVAVIFRKITGRLNLPSVIGEIIGGIILGQTILGRFFPEYYQFLFSSYHIERETLVKLGQMFFLFVVGLETDLVFLKQQKREIISISFFGIMVPFCIGVVAVFLLDDIWGAQLCSKNMLALFLGVAISISALPVIARILMDVGILKSQIGTVILSAATINDLLGWILFSIVLGNINSKDYKFTNIASLGIGILLVILIGVIFYLTQRNRIQSIKKLKKFKKSVPNHNITIVAIFILLGSAVTEAIGIHAVFGAFLIGVLFSKRAQVSSGKFEGIKEITNNFFVPIYFVSVGLKVDFITSFDIVLVIIVTSIACIGKVSGAFIGAKVSGVITKDALVVAVAMNARGAMEMILASIAYEYRIIDQRLFVALVAMAIITTMISGPIIQKLNLEKIKSNKLVTLASNNAATDG